MICRLLTIAAVVILLLPNILYAGSVSMDLHTYFVMSEEEDNNNDVRGVGTLYEYLSLDVKNIRGSKVSFVFTGWGKLETEDKSLGYDEDGRSDSDVSAAYIDYTNRGINIRIGKQVIVNNKSYEGISGVSIRTRFPFNLSLSAYSGIPEELDDNPQAGDEVSGGRVAIGRGGVIEIGVGYLDEADNGETLRREVSTDLWIMPLDILEVYGQAVKNDLTDSYSYSSAAVNLYITPKITLNAKYDKTSFKDYFDEKLEIPEVFSSLNETDELETMEGSLIFDFTENMSLNIDIKDYDFKEDEDASSHGLGYKVSSGNITTFLSYYKTDSRDKNEGYFDEYSFYVMLDMNKLSLSFDAVVDLFEKELYGRDTSTAVITSAGYKISDAFELSVDLDYSRDPEYDENFKLFVRAEYYL